MLTKPPKFTYNLHQPGSANATLIADNIEVEFELTNISNPLGDLLEGLVTMITTPSHIWGEDNVCHIVWYGESSSYNWKIQRIDNDNCNVQITESVDFFGDDTETELIEFNCQFIQLIQSIISELDTFIKTIGLLNYSQKWQKDDFPITQFLFLKKTLIENNLWAAPEYIDTTNILRNEILMLLA